MSNGEIRFETFESAALRGNPLGDAHIRQLPVYLPYGYAQSSARYPMVMMLSGFGSRGHAMLNDSLWDENVPQMLDRMIANRTLPPVIAILPDASTRYGGSQYVNSSATGNYEDYLLEIVRFVDEHFRTVGTANTRAVMGISSGGFGSMWMGMKHPDIFGMIADHSGDKYFEYCYKPDFFPFLRTYAREGEAGIRKLLANPGAVRPKGSDFFGTLNIAAMAACYSPNPAAALGFDLPFNPHTGELLPDVWARWESHDPVFRAADYAENLRKLNLLYFECGTRDEYNLQYGARIFKTRLEALNIPFEYAEFDDGHRSLGYRYETSLQLFAARW